MATRTVTGDVVTAAGDAWPDGALSTVTFTIKEGTWTSTEHAPPDRVTATLSTGAFSATLFAPATYEVRMPNGYIFDLVVPEGAAETIETLRAAAESEPEITSILTTTVAHKSATVVNAAGTGDYETLALALAGGAKWIVLKPGTYTGAVTISQDDVKLFGYGATWTEQTGAHTFTVSGARVSIEGLTIAGSHDGDEGDMTAFNNIYITGDHATVHRCKFTNLQGYAVQVDAADYATISRCYASNVATAASPVKYTRYCFYVTNASLRANVHHNFVTGWSQAIGLWYGSNDCEVRRNILVNNLGHETGPARRAAMEDFGDDAQNTFNRWLNNYVDGSTGNCMELAQGLYGTLVQGNTFKNSGTGYTTNAGVVFVTGGDGGAGGLTSDHVRIIDNDIYGRSDNTVNDTCGVTGGVNDCLWEGNRFYEFEYTTATLMTLATAQTTENVKIRNNVFKNCGGASGPSIIRLQTDGCIVEGNSLISAVASTRGIFADASDGHTIVGNLIDVPGRALDLDDNNKVLGNTITSAADIGVVAVTGNDFRDNTILNDTAGAGDWYTINVTGNQNTLYGNRITRTGPGRVLVLDGTDNRITDNWLVHSTNENTIRLTSTTRRNTVTNNTCVRPDNALGINDEDATVSNSINFNHTLTTLGTW
jgi:hypothetical protein